MSLTVSDLIEDAEARAHPWIGPQFPARGVMVRQLAALDEEFLKIIVHSRPELVAAEGTDITITDNTGNEAGYTLTPAGSDTVLAYLDFYLQDSSDTVYKIFVPPLNRRYDAAGRYTKDNPAGLIINDKFYPVDENSENWATSTARTYFRTGETVSWTYVPSATRVTGLSDTLVSPDLAREYFTASLVLGILLANGGDDRMVKIARDSVDMALEQAQFHLYRSGPTDSRYGE